MQSIKNNLRIHARFGLSLIEIMIAMVMTLIVLGAMMAAFSYGSREMHHGRAAIDLISRLQSAESQLRTDLERITVDVRPHHFQSSPPNGYLEIVEGPRSDYNGTDYIIDSATKGNNSHLGDNDDYISFTMKAAAEPFRNGAAKSHYAEVHWYLIGNKLHRRLKLLGENSLAATGYRENREYHSPPADPNLQSTGLSCSSGSSLRQTDLPPPVPAPHNCTVVLSPSTVVLTNVIAFDVQVYDPDARRYVVRAGADPEDPIVDIADPSEIGAQLGVDNGQLSPFCRGAYVDLGKGRGARGATPILFNLPHPRYGSQTIYDTGTSQYDNDEVNDRARNGIDDEPFFEDGSPNGIVDDAGEKTSLPPYNVPLRGIKISMRVIEPNTKQIRQLTIIKSFVKE